MRRGTFLGLLLLLATGIQVHCRPRKLQSTATCSADSSAGYVVYRLQCADESLVDAAGNFWYGNKSPVLAGTSMINVQHGETILKTVGGAPAEPQTVYKSECAWKADTTLLLPVPGPGDYRVKMLNVEAYHTTAGKRIFSVVAGGITVMDHTDLFVEAGNVSFVETDTTFLASTQGTTLQLDLKVHVDQARFSGIVITLIRPVSPVYRLQCADEPLIDAAGNFWYGNKSPVLAGTGVINVQHGETILKTVGGAPAEPQTVYKSECAWAGSVTLQLPVPRPGLYEVKLLNVEAWEQAPLLRKFSVSAEGATVLTDLDLFAQAGNTRFVQTDNTFLVTVNGPQTQATTLNLTLTANVGQPRISGIVVTPICDTTPFESRLQCNTAPSADGWGNTWGIVDNTKVFVKSTSETVLGLASDNLQSIYKRECIPRNTDNMSVSFPVPRAAYYDVTVLNTEPWCDGITDTAQNGHPCTRVFDIVAEGKTVVADLEIIARTPCRQLHYAYNSTFTVKVTDLELNLDFIKNPASNQYPRFSAIYIKASSQNILEQPGSC